MSRIIPSWIAVDWGTTACRAWAMDAGGSVLAEVASDKGMAMLERTGFEPALLDMIAPWLDGASAPLDVLACGMVGSRQGWAEAPYSAVPCAPLSARFVSAPTTDPRLSVRIIPGIKQLDPADVMRGEETQIAGFLSLNAQFDGVICLPGTHTKWAHISAGEIVSFQTAMTGELFACLTRHSVLRHSTTSDDWDDDAFLTALANAQSRPAALATSLFSLRAEALLNDLPAATARARLSATLIGIELAAARPYWLGQQVALIGAARLSHLYEKALSAQGLAVIRTNGDAMTRAGLAAAYTLTQQTEPAP